MGAQESHAATHDTRERRCCGLDLTGTFLGGVLFGRREYRHFATAQALERIEQIGLVAGQPWGALGQPNSLLEHLWTLSGLGEPMELAKSPKWTTIGFQNQDPLSDLRAAPVLIMQQLIYLAEHKPEAYAEQLACCRETGFPLACVSFNCSYRLLQHLELYRAPLPPSMLASDQARRGFAALIDLSPDALAEIHCSCVGLMHRLWLDLHREQPGRLDLMNGLFDAMQRALEDCLCGATAGSKYGATGDGLAQFVAAMEALPKHE